MIIVCTEAAANSSSQNQNRAHGTISCSVWNTEFLLSLSGEAGRLKKLFEDSSEIQI